jgi:hypothetical protein
MKRHIFFYSLLISSFSFAQTDSIKKLQHREKLKITDYYLMPGFSLSTNNYVTLDEFKRLNPNSELLKNDFTNYTQYPPGSMNLNADIAFKIGFKLNENNSKQFQLGVLHSTYNNLSTHYSKSDKKRFDTVTSSQPGIIYYLDSVHTTNYSMTYNANVLALTASLIYRTNPEARWSLYAGVGFAAGVSYKSMSTIFMNDYYNIETRKPNGELVANSYSNINNGYTNEYIRNKPSFQFMLNIPMGVDFRMGKRKEFFKRLHLFYELQPAFQLNVVSKIAPRFCTAGTNTLGLRVTF